MAASEIATSAQPYDVIIIGGGINGLTCAAYLARAGARILLVERRHETGGGLITEDFGGFRYNLHATYHLMADVMPPAADFDLAGMGVVPLYPEAQVAFPLRDGRALVLYRDVRRSLAAVRAFAPADGERFERMYGELAELCDQILVPATYAPPLPPIEQMMMFGRDPDGLGQRLTRLSELSPLELLDEYGLRDPQLRALLLFLSVLWGIPPASGGLGYLLPLYICRMTRMALIRGGSHRLSSALARLIVAHGGEILDGEEVSEIRVRDDEVVGVATRSGKQLEATAVVSTLNPAQTFLELVGERHLPTALTRQVRCWKWESRSLFGVHLSLPEAPSYRAADACPDVERALLAVLGYESEEEILAHLQEIGEHRLPPPAGHATVTSLFDPSQAPDGCHTGRWECFAPFAPSATAAGASAATRSAASPTAGRTDQAGASTAGVSWDALKDDYAARCLAGWEEYLRRPLRPLRRYPYSPLDIERKLSSMKDGSIKHGDYNPLQMGYFRPNDLCSSTRTPLRGLYVAGASVYPGGMILAGPGYLAAGVVADDLEIARWWREPASVTRARERGYLR